MFNTPGLVVATEAGVNVTEKIQLAPGAKVAPQVFVCLYSAADVPVKVALVNVNG
jgi:hypothetical protein